ncbi:YfbU family protein [Vibrio furnissii]|uniref:YfbU family protein n=1 Tax=Vibrio furnissii TaxID=29494 RepID=UPI0002FB4699|nr:YfbU family protein [Vibrio furnissii]UON48444.1 YfbU family protein [Vibrio furnissii]SUP45302.1 YfbU domain [Vibrio furnissii]
MILNTFQRIVVILLCDIHKRLKTPSHVDSDFILESVVSGNDWALDWECRRNYIYFEDDNEQLTHFVHDVLEMFSYIETSLSKLNTDLDQYNNPALVFQGFDLASESKYVHAMAFVTQKMDRFTEFSDRSIRHVHVPTVPTYSAMLSQFIAMGRPFPLTHRNLHELIAAAGRIPEPRSNPCKTGSI